MPTNLNPQPSAGSSELLRCVRPNALRLALVFAVLSLLLRFAPLPENFATFGALSMFCGLCLQGANRWLVPLAVLFAADCIGHFLNIPGMGFYFMPAMILNYVGFAAFSLTGAAVSHIWQRRGFSVRASLSTLPAGIVAGSALFFAISNFGAWLDPQMQYAATWDGLQQCYWMGLPFWRSSLASDVLFGMGFVGSAYAISVWVSNRVRLWA
jgi:hypothetical protein